MKPYYEQDGITIYHGDCREILPQLEPVDVVLTDPPYSLSVQSDHQHKTGKGTRRLNFFAGDTDWRAMTQAVTERVGLAAALAPAIYVWCGHRQFGRIVDGLEASGFKRKRLTLLNRHYQTRWICPDR